MKDISDNNTVLNIYPDFVNKKSRVDKYYYITTRCSSWGYLCTFTNIPKYCNTNYQHITTDEYEKDIYSYRGSLELGNNKIYGLEQRIDPEPESGPDKMCDWVKWKMRNMEYQPIYPLIDEDIDKKE